MHEEQLKEEFAVEFGKLAHDSEKLIVYLTPLEAWVVMGNLQLALRHPTNKGGTSGIARSVAERLQKAVASDSALAEVARRGWEPQYDE